jgi:hypothetical protein
MKTAVIGHHVIHVWAQFQVYLLVMIVDPFHPKHHCTKPN